MHTPTIYELLDDPVYRRYMKTVPRLIPTLADGNPWQVWALTKDDRWKGGQFPTYGDAWKVLVKAVRNHTAKDVAIVSRRQFFDPPGQWQDYTAKVQTSQGVQEVVKERWVQTFNWDIGFHWCGRCRRPTRFMHATQQSHHALRRAIALSDEDTRRCLYCGIRQVAQPTFRSTGDTRRKGKL